MPALDLGKTLLREAGLLSDVVLFQTRFETGCLQIFTKYNQKVIWDSMA